MARFLEIDIDFKSLSSLSKGLKEYGHMLTKEFQHALTDTILDIEAEAKRRCPVDTGRLRASITPKIESPTEGYVGTNTEYAAAVEYGTKPHTIKPKRGKALAWKDKKTGKTRFAKVVNHPGTKARPFLEPAYLQGKEAAEKHYSKAFKRLERKLKRMLG